MIKIDFHTHSTDSPDGGISEDDYAILFSKNIIDAAAITDHQSVKFAKKKAKDPRFGDNIIVGQEILTTRGEIIGLFLSKKIENQQSPHETIVEIKKQGGFVLVPHPEDKHRSGMSIEAMDEVIADIDAVEAFNGRQIGKPKADIRHWARQNNIAVVACSDAHSKSGVGRTYTIIESMPKTSQELRIKLAENSRTVFERPPLRAYLAPKLNRLRRR